MAKHRRPGRPKGSKNKSDAKSKRPLGLSKMKSRVVREILGVFIFVFSIIIFLGIFGVGGSFSSVVSDLVRSLFGWAVFIVPPTLMVFSIALFYPEKLQTTPYTYLGILGFISSFAGMFHIFVSVDDSLYLADLGSGGGWVGYYIQGFILELFNPALSFIVLLGFAIGFFLLTSNTSIRDILRVFPAKEKDFLEKPKKAVRVNDSASARVPLILKKTSGETKEAPEKPIIKTADDIDWSFPSLDLLDSTSTKPESGNIQKNAEIIQNTLANFSVRVAMGDVNVGPTVTQYTLKPDEGVKLSKVTNLDRDLALALAAHPVRIEAPIPGKSLVGIEIPNKSAAIVRLRTILESDTFTKRRSNLSVVLGLDVAGHPQIADITKMPHLLIAGATGSGKSVCINTILMSLLYQNSPKDLKMILVDPKRVELAPYNAIPHLISPVITEADKTVSALKWAVIEMERRYKILQDKGKRNIEEYKRTGLGDEMPYIVIVIDELAELMAVSANEVEHYIVRIAQLARAVGIHLVLATQRPSVNVITGLIKANITTRIAFSVASQVDSRTILDQAGAEKLLGMGDMLFISSDTPKPKRIQGAFLSEKEVTGITDFIKKQGEPDYNQDILTQHTKSSGDLGAPDDELFIDAADCAVRAGKASASLLQRRLRIGYARAARLLDLLEERGIIGPADGARPRDVLISDISEVLEESEAEES